MNRGHAPGQSVSECWALPLTDLVSANNQPGVLFSPGCLQQSSCSQFLATGAIPPGIFCLFWLQNLLVLVLLLSFVAVFGTRFSTFPPRCFTNVSICYILAFEYELKQRRHRERSLRAGTLVRWIHVFSLAGGTEKLSSINLRLWRILAAGGGLYWRSDAVRCWICFLLTHLGKARQPLVSSEIKVVYMGWFI